MTWAELRPAFAKRRYPCAERASAHGLIARNNQPTEAEQHDILELLHRRRKKSSTIFCSQYDPSGWYDQLGGDDSPLAEAILDRIKHDAYKINIIPTDPDNYRSMREVYGLDPALSE